MSAQTTADVTLRDAHRRRIATQLPALSFVVNAGALTWFGLVALAQPISLAAVLGVVAFQVTVFSASAHLCRRDPLATRVTLTAVVACILVGCIWVVIFTTTATVAAMLMFATLTLFGAAPLVLVWGLAPQLLFQGTLTLIWVIGLAFLPRFLPLLELAAAVGFGNLIALFICVWATRSFDAEVLGRTAASELERQVAASRDAYRALAENAPDFIWSIDRQGRWTYVNEALARRCGRTVDAMIGRPVAEILTAHRANPDPVAVIDRRAAGEHVGPQLLQMTTPTGPCWVEAVATPIFGPVGELVGVQGSSRDVTERLRAEERLRVSEERFRSVFANAPIGMAVVAPDGEVLQANRALTTMLGYVGDEVVGTRPPDVIHPDDVGEVQALVEATLAGKCEGFSAEYRHLRRDGQIVWSQVQSFLERDAEGQPRHFITQIADVTERRAAETALSASERKFRSFAESMPVGVIINDATGIRYVNGAVADATGYSREELLRMNVWELVHPEERELAHQRVDARFHGEERPPHIEYRLMTKSGEEVWVDITVTPLEVDGRMALLSTAFDVTERKRTEQALRASEDRYRGLVESQRELVVRFQPDGVLTFVNDAYCATYGIGRDDAIGRPFWPLVHPDDVPAVEETMAEMVRPPYRGQIEARSRTVNGWRWFQWETSAIRDANKVVVEGQASGRDVTERRQAVDALQSSLLELRRSEEKLRLLAQRQTAIREEERKRVSLDLHDDVCQELVGIGIMVESVRRRLDSGAADMTGDLARVTGYLNEVVEHLRLLARDLRPMLLQDLGLEGGLRSLAGGLGTNETRVEALFPTPIPRLSETVELTIYRIAQEALTNAIRHACARCVTLTLTLREGRLHLEVRDDGSGFDPATRRRPALGLASMEERAQALGGRLQVRSQRGGGTMVSLECPITVEDHERASSNGVVSAGVTSESTTSEENETAVDDDTSRHERSGSGSH